jgi:hypothetical protein
MATGVRGILKQFRERTGLVEMIDGIRITLRPRALLSIFRASMAEVPCRLVPVLGLR